MSYTEYMRRKAAAAPTVINNQKLRTASELTQERRLMASSDFSVNGQQYGTMRGDLLLTETSVNQKQPTSFKKQTGRPKNASDFTSYVGANPIQQGNTFANGNTQNAGKLTVAAACVINSAAKIDDPVPYITGTTNQVVAKTVARSGSDFIRERLACQKAQGEQHIQSELGPSVFKDDTIRKPEFNKQYLSGAKTCAPNDMFPKVEHAHSVTVPRQAWSARPTKSGIPVFKVPSLDYPVQNQLLGNSIGDISPLSFSISNAVGTSPNTFVPTSATWASNKNTYVISGGLPLGYITGVYVSVVGFTDNRYNVSNALITQVNSTSFTVANTDSATPTSAVAGTNPTPLVTAIAGITLSGSTLTIPTGNIPGGATNIDSSQMASIGNILTFSATLATVPSSNVANTIDFGYSIDGITRTNRITLAKTDSASTVNVNLNGMTATGFPTTIATGKNFGYIATPTSLTLTYDGTQYPVTAGFTPTTTGMYNFLFDTAGTGTTPSAGFSFTSFSLTAQQYLHKPPLPNCFTGKNTVGVFSRGGILPKDALRYVEKHHGNDLLVVNPRKPIFQRYQIPDGTPAHLKINDANLVKTPNM